jgi:hypothetical protein
VGFNSAFKGLSKIYLWNSKLKVNDLSRDIETEVQVT